MSQHLGYIRQIFRTLLAIVALMFITEVSAALVKDHSLMTRYNIVLVPENLSSFVNFSRTNFKELVALDKEKDKEEKKTGIYYLLGSNSIPHISICQFMCESNRIDLVIQDFLKWSKGKTIFPNLNSLNYTALSGDFAPRFAAELGVERSNDLIALHKQAVQFITDQGLEIKMSAFDQAENTRYRPHLTLAMFYPRENYRLLGSFEQLLGKKMKFSLYIGRADESWQLIEILSQK